MGVISEQMIVLETQNLSKKTRFLCHKHNLPDLDILLKYVSYIANVCLGNTQYEQNTTFEPQQ